MPRLAGFAAHRGYLDFVAVVVAAMLGAIIGDHGGSSSAATWLIDPDSIHSALHVATTGSVRVG